MKLSQKMSHAVFAAGGFLSRRRRPRYVYLCAFFLPVLAMGLLWAVRGVAPFGHRMILAHDQWHQYYPFYLDLRRRLLSGGSLLHSWTTGLGTSYLPLFAYYLASPLNWLAALLPEKLAMVYYTLTVLVRIGLAGMFFALFLRKTTDRSELVISVFSTMYALSAFLMGYYWNAIWLDTVALLPLVVVGTLSLLRERRFVLYISSLALSVFCSYYIGFFVCLFVLLLFIGYHVVEWDDLGGFWARFFRIGLCTLIALGLTAVLTLPTFLGMRSTSSAENKFPDSNALNMVSGQTIPAQQAMENASSGKLADLYTFFGSVPTVFPEDKTVSVKWVGPGDALTALRLGYVGAFLDSFDLPGEGLKATLSNTGTLTEPTTMEGLPNIFCGFSTLLLAMLFLFCKKISRRERIFTVFLLLFFAAGFIFRTLDYIWHGLHFPNMLPYRFSFLWCFTVIWMGFRAYTQLESVRWWRVLFALIPGLLVLLCVIGGSHPAYAVAATTLVASLTVLFLMLYCLRSIKREHFVFFLCLCMLAEAAGCAALGVDKVGTTDSSYYPTQKDSTAVILQKMEELEADTVDLWRAEVTTKQTLNDGTLLGYRGVSVFSSAANARISRFLQTIGLASSVAGNRYVYQEADPFTNLLLGVKYLIDRNDRYTDPTYFRQMAKEGSVRLLQNKYYIPLGFLVDEDALDYDVTETTSLPFSRLNRLFRQMTGEETPLFYPLTVDSVEALGDASLTNRTGYTFSVSAEKPDENNCAEATVVMPQRGHLCIYSKSSSTSDLVVFVNGERQYTYSDKYGYNRYMGLFQEGDRISIRYRNAAEKTGQVTFGAALFRDEVFQQGYDKLSANVMYTNLVTDTRIEGVIRVEEEGLLYTSIPCDEGWTVTVDDEPVRITPVGEAMIAFRLEPGLHAIVLSFEAPGFSLGLRITLICLAAFLLLLILALIGRFSRPPIVKVKMKLDGPDQEPEGIEAIPTPDAPGGVSQEGGTSMPPLDTDRPWQPPDLPQSARDELYGYDFDGPGLAGTPEGEDAGAGSADDKDVRIWSAEGKARGAGTDRLPELPDEAREAAASDEAGNPAKPEASPEGAQPEKPEALPVDPEDDAARLKAAVSAADEAARQALAAGDTGVFRPLHSASASSAPEAGGAGRFAADAAPEQPRQEHLPEDEIRSLEELDSFLKGTRAEKEE